VSVRKDPEGNEIKALLQHTGDLAGKRVLEIGGGYGRLTWRFAGSAGEVVTIDPNPDKIARGKREMPAELKDRVTMLEFTLEEYQNSRPAMPFDVALMSWAL
jgi:ubiquinone/menaquinone biosynthesis C-methylase UbiE